MQIVGGTFYDNAEFDEGLVERLREQILHVLKNGSQATLTDISNYIRSSGFGKVGGSSTYSDDRSRGSHWNDRAKNNQSSVVIMNNRGRKCNFLLVYL